MKASLIILLLLAPVAVFCQSIELPSPKPFARGENDCKDLYVAIASQHSSVRMGDVLEASAVVPIAPKTRLSYAWLVSNGQIISGQGTPKIRIQSTTPPPKTLAHVSIALFAARTTGSRCNVTATHEVPIGPKSNINNFGSVDRVNLDEQLLTHPASPECRPREREASSKDMTVAVTTTASDLEKDVLTYSYFVSAGRIIGRGAKVEWDLSEADEGTYSIMVGVDDGNGMLGKMITKTVTVRLPDQTCDRECPTISITGPAELSEESSFTANVSGGSQQSVTYDWSVVGGEIISGQGTPSIVVKVNSRSGTVKVKIGGLDPLGNCTDSAAKEFQ